MASRDEDRPPRMSPSSRARPPTTGRPVSPERRLEGALLVLAVLGAFPGLILLPNGAAALRLAGVSLLWWYGGLVAPVLGVIGVVLLHRRRADDVDDVPDGGSDDEGRGPSRGGESP